MPKFHEVSVYMCSRSMSRMGLLWQGSRCRCEQLYHILSVCGEIGEICVLSVCPCRMLDPPSSACFAKCTCSKRPTRTWAAVSSWAVAFRRASAWGLLLLFRSLPLRNMTSTAFPTLVLHYSLKLQAFRSWLKRDTCVEFRCTWLVTNLVLQ